jgi:hypothetical protein
MKCKYSVSIEAYQDGMLDGKQQNLVKDHIKICEDCQARLDELTEADMVIARFKSVKPELQKPGEFRNEVLQRIAAMPQSRSTVVDFKIVMDNLLLFLLQPTTKVAFISAAIVIIGLFGYQQYHLVEKMDALTLRMENTMILSESTSADRIEILSKYQLRAQSSEENIDQLVSDFASLQLRYKVLVKALKSKYPDVYDDLEQIIDENSMPLPKQKLTNYENL